MKKRRIALFILLILTVGFLYGQEIITAGRYMDLVGERYSSIRDFEATLNIRSGSSNMVGTVSHLSPSLMRVDFTQPANQVIVFNGEMLTVYLPEFRVTLTQAINRSRAPTGGLTLLRRNYTPSYVTGPDPVPLDAGSSERVIKLRLRRNTVAEGFTEIILSINPETRLIRRMEGRTIADTEVRFDFSNIRINQGIPSARFIYDAPPTANVYHNFLFRDPN